jgi:opacity protein-like surface antigen
MRRWLVLALFCASSGPLFAQAFEASGSFGQTVFPGGSKNLGSGYTMNDGFAMALRMTLNSWRFFGTEFGYGYNHTSVGIPASTSIGLPGQVTQIPAQTISVPIHQGFGDFLVYALPEGTHVRPFAAAGLQFSSFFPPGSSAYYGNQTTKFGFNYGGGIKVRVTSMWGLRFDVRWYNMSKPFDFPGQSGRLNLAQFTGGISFNL